MLFRNTIQIFKCQNLLNFCEKVTRFFFVLLKYFKLRICEIVKFIHIVRHNKNTSRVLWYYITGKSGQILCSTYKLHILTGHVERTVFFLFSSSSGSHTSQYPKSQNTERQLSGNLNKSPTEFFECEHIFSLCCQNPA